MIILQSHTSTQWATAFNDTVFTTSLMAEAIPAYLQKSRWFGAKTTRVKTYLVEKVLPYHAYDEQAYLVFIEVLFYTANTETYFVPLKIIADKPDDDRGIICKLLFEDKEYFLIDAVYDADFREAIFRDILNGEEKTVGDGFVLFENGKCLESFDRYKPIESRLLNAEQSNTTIVYNDKYYLKLYRKLFRDANPDYEITHFLSEKAGFRYSPRFAGSITWKRTGYYQVSLGLMQEELKNQGTAWEFYLNEVDGFFKRCEAAGIQPTDLPKQDLYKPKKIEQLPDVYHQLIGLDALLKTKTLARTTCQMHLALFSDRFDRNFSPTIFSSDYRVWLLNRLMYQFDNRLNLLEQNLDKLSGAAKQFALEFMERKDEIKNRILGFDDGKLNSNRIRIHGDFHLGQVLYDNDIFYMLDFEGEPESTIRDRKVKQPPMKDVAGVFRSFHYAVFANAFNNTYKIDFETVKELGGRYYRAIVAVFMDTYVNTAFDNGLNIGYYDEIDYLLRYHLFEKAIYEMGYELNSRPDWVIIPLKGLMQLLNND